MNVEFVDNSDEVLEELEDAAMRALETCGLIAEGYAVDLAPVAEEYGGTLRGSITHRVDEQKKTAYIGTNVEYAPYVELGTGKYYPGGRPTPWVYQDKQGNWHYTAGQRAQPYVKPAVADHAQEYRDVIKSEMKQE